MNNPELLIWLIPGYAALLLYRRLNPLPSKQGWEWVFQTASAGIICFVVSRFVLLLGFTVASQRNVSDLRSAWASVFPIPYSFSLLVGVLIGAPVATLVLALLRSAADTLERLFRKVLDVPADDMLLFRLRELSGKFVFVTMKSGKVYVGGLEDFTQYSDAPERHMLITPVLSGYRDPTNQQVVFTTEYMGEDASEHAPAPEQTDVEPTLIPLAEVVSLSRFSEKMHNRFVAMGTTRFDRHFAAAYHQRETWTKKIIRFLKKALIGR